MSKKMEKSTENAIFLDGREYTAKDLYRLIGLLVGNGVYANELAPTATNENMSITHGSGHAWIGGVAYWNTTPFVMDIYTADGSLNRYDSLMLRRDLSNNEVYAVIVQGEYATNPTAPDITRNAEIFDLKICDIYVPAGCTKITQDQIIDTRLDSSVCGVPVFPVEHMDMTSFYRQIATDLANFQRKEEADFAAWVEDQQETNLAAMAALVEIVQNTSDESKAEILDLLAQLNNLVDSDTVGELISQINKKLSKDGGKMTGNIDMDGYTVTNVGTPVNKRDTANKEYVDTKSISATLYASGWTPSETSGFIQTIEVAGLTDDKKAKAYPARPDTLAEKLALREETAKVCASSRSGSSMTFECWEETPALDIPIIVEVYV